MKYILLLLVFFCSANIYSQDIKILDEFILGKDSIESISRKIKINELNIYTQNFGNLILQKITYDKFNYKANKNKIILILVNNKLYSIRFYPKTDDLYLKYLNYLNTNYKIYDIKDRKIKIPNDKNFNNKIWVHTKVLIEFDDMQYDDIDNKYIQSFIHYDVKLLVKYPDYKNF